MQFVLDKYLKETDMIDTDYNVRDYAVNFASRAMLGVPATCGYQHIKGQNRMLLIHFVYAQT